MALSPPHPSRLSLTIPFLCYHITHFSEFFIPRCCQSLQSFLLNYLNFLKRHNFSFIFAVLAYNSSIQVCWLDESIDGWMKKINFSRPSWRLNLLSFFLCDTTNDINQHVSYKAPQLIFSKSQPNKSEEIIGVKSNINWVETSTILKNLFSSFEIWIQNCLWEKLDTSWKLF